MSLQAYVGASSQHKLRFEEIQPTLLLFLNKVQRIVVTDMTGGGQDSLMQKQQLDGGLVEIHYGTDGQQLQQWLVVKEVHTPTILRAGKQRDTTEVALAFELSKAHPSQQQACAFLPLREYGLNFIVQVSLL